ncbi:MAG TPA: hypothetical protein VMT01_00740 [Candidatus Acidoferrum sp.]|nr:hypothetical protein [Candidatus Acidoferrum sp.]
MILIVAMLAIGVILIIYDNVFKPGYRFTHATFISVIGFVLCVMGLILIRKLD